MPIVENGRTYAILEQPQPFVERIVKGNSPISIGECDPTGTVDK